MILGIDPGLSGGLAIVDGAVLHAAEPMPVTTSAINDKKQIVDGQGLAELVASWQLFFGVTDCCIERVGARPNQGVTSMFNFGLSYGITIGVVTALGMDIRYVTPQRWKKDLELDGLKDSSRYMAHALWPDFDDKFRRKKDDGIAEAALIGLWHDSHASE